ncbi:MAG: zinc ABC transporter substrate-binding protein ZnuA [Arsenophonus endosymbiont of Ceratovacuna japonica]
MLHKIKKNIQKLIEKKYIISMLLISFLFTSYANIVTSIRPLGFIASDIAHGITNVQILLPNGISPHNYILKPSDLKKIKNANLFIWVSSDLETFLTKPLTKLSNKHLITLLEDPEIKLYLLKNNYNSTLINNKNINKYYNKINYPYYSHYKYNMHIWLSPDIVRIIANIIYNRLIILYPNYKKQLDINFHIFNNKLTQADKNITNMLFFIRKKQYFVFHDAYSYFENHYHLSSLGYFTINPIIQPGAKRLYQIKKILIQKKVICVFVEPQFKPAVIKTMIKNTNVQIGILDPLGSNIKLSKDNYIKFLISLSNQFKNCLDKH